MKKGIIFKLISFVLILSLVFVSALTTAAATADEVQTKYISDVKLITAGSVEEAKKQLPDGYELLEGTNKAGQSEVLDLDKTMAQPEYLAVKYTYQLSEALTDIKMMNQAGNYSFSGYQEVLKTQKAAIEKELQSIIPMIEAFRENYNAEEPTELTKAVYDYLTYIIKDESVTKDKNDEDNPDYGTKNMADFLLYCDLDNPKELQNVFLQGNDDILQAIKSMLVFTSEYSDENSTWLTRLCDLGPDSLLDIYLLDTPMTSQAKKNMANDFEDGAKLIYDEWDNLYKLLQEEESKEEEKNENLEEQNIDNEEEAEDAVAEYITDGNEGVDAMVNMSKVGTYTRLSELTYGDDTLLAFFNREKDEVTLEELYPVVYSMTPAQRELLRSQSLATLIDKAGSIGDASDSQEALDIVNGMLNNLTEVSVYAGVDRDKFTEKCAVTSNSSDIQTSSGKSGWAKFFATKEDYMNSSSKAATFALNAIPLVVSGALFATSQALYSKLSKAVDAAKTTLLEETQAADKVFAERVNLLFIDEELLEKADVAAMESAQNYVNTAQESQAKALTRAKVANVARVVTGILVIAFAAYTAFEISQLVRANLDKKEGNANAYTTMPSYIMDYDGSRDGEKYEFGDSFYYYSAVKDKSGSIADLNGYKSLVGWLLLYTTKDSLASNGRPITEIKITTNSETIPAGYDPVTIFGEGNACNVLNKTYTGMDDTEGGIRLYIKRDNNSDKGLLAGSATTGGKLALFGGIILLVGLAVGILLDKFVISKKRKEEK